MEFEQTFRQCAVIQSGCFEQGGYHCFIVAVFDQSGNIFSVDTLAGYIQVVIESKILDSVEECLFELGCRPVIVGGQELEQVLELRLAAPEAGTNFTTVLSVFVYASQAAR